MAFYDKLFLFIRITKKLKKNSNSHQYELLSLEI
jgi:hypothetical protein